MSKGDPPTITLFEAWFVNASYLYQEEKDVGGFHPAFSMSVSFSILK